MLRDVVTPNLTEDARIRGEVLARKRIFTHQYYDIYLFLYPGVAEKKDLQANLLTCMVSFKHEELRVMLKLWTDEIHGNYDHYLAQAVRRLKTEGRGPFHLVRDAKTWANIPFTMIDRAALRLAGADAPKPDPKTFWADPDK